MGPVPEQALPSWTDEEARQEHNEVQQRQVGAWRPTRRNHMQAHRPESRWRPPQPEQWTSRQVYISVQTESGTIRHDARQWPEHPSSLQMLQPPRCARYQWRATLGPMW